MILVQIWESHIWLAQTVSDGAFKASPGALVYTNWTLPDSFDVTSNGGKAPVFRVHMSVLRFRGAYWGGFSATSCSSPL